MCYDRLSVVMRYKYLDVRYFIRIKGTTHYLGDPTFLFSRYNFSSGLHIINNPGISHSASTKGKFR